jgi:hypothetical protein
MDVNKNKVRFHLSYQLALCTSEHTPSQMSTQDTRSLSSVPPHRDLVRGIFIIYLVPLSLFILAAVLEALGADLLVHRTTSSAEP